MIIGLFRSVYYDPFVPLFTLEVFREVVAAVAESFRMGFPVQFNDGCYVPALQEGEGKTNIKARWSAALIFVFPHFRFCA